MAKYWVGGTGNWDASDTTHWSDTSGGAGGSSVPGASDDVILDGSSGGGTVTVTATVSVTSITGGAFTGTLDTNGQTITTSGAFNFSGSGTRTLNLGSSTITCGSWSLSTATNLTFDTGTSTIILPITSSSSGGTFNGGGKTYNIVQINAHGSQIIQQANTFGTLTRTGPGSTTCTLGFQSNQTITGTFTVNGDSATSRVLVKSSTIGSSKTITAATVTVTNADFQDITGAGAGSWNLSAITGGSGDCGGNSGITFTTGQTNYWVGGTGNWATVSEWASSSGGAASSGRVPLPQDDAVFDANSFSGAGQTVTQDMPRAGKNINWTGATNTPTWTTSTAASIFGSLTLIAGMTLTASTQTYTFEGRSTYTLTNAGKTWAKRINLTAPGGTLTLQDAFISTGSNSIVLTDGTFNANNFNVTISNVSISGTNTRALQMGSGTWELTGTAAWSVSSATNFTLTPSTSTIKFTDTSSTAITFTGASLTYYNIWFARGTSTAINTITGNNTFNDFRDSGTAAHTIKFTGGTTTTLTSVTGLTGTLGNVITLTSTTSTAFTLTQATGVVDLDYLAYSYATVTGGAIWYAGSNSTDSGSNTGWHFRFTNPGNAYTSDNTYATATATSGVLSVYLSKDAGLNWTSALTETFAGSDSLETYGTGSTELWGSSFTGDDVDDTSFRLRIQHGQYVQIYKTFGFSITASLILTGIEVAIEAKYTGGTISVDLVKAKIYYGTTGSAVQAGSLAYASDGVKDGDPFGTGSGALVYYDANAGWVAADTGRTIVASLADDTFRGPTTKQYNAGATVAQWEAVYLDSASKWQLTDADAESTAGSVMIAIATEAGTADNAMRVALPGTFIRNDAWNWTVGGTIYLSATPGALTQTKPSGTDDVVRICGWASTADIIFWNPSPDYITIV